MHEKKNANLPLIKKTILFTFITTCSERKNPNLAFTICDGHNTSVLNPHNCLSKSNLIQEQLIQLGTLLIYMKILYNTEQNTPYNNLLHGFIIQLSQNTTLFINAIMVYLLYIA